MKSIDNLKLIQKFDKNDMFSLILNFPEQCEKAINLAENFKTKKYKGIRNIVITGLGGSAIGGDLLKDYLFKKIDIPIIVNRDYEIHNFVNSNTLVLAISYSGNTEETISAYKKAKEKGAKIISITSGGELEKMSKQDNIPYIIIDKGYPPRCALGLLFFSMFIIFGKIGLIKIDREEIEETILILKKLRKKLEPSKKENLAKQIAEKLNKKIVLIYAGEKFRAVANRWKTQLNENSKISAFYNVFPELNHNEIVGFESLIQLTKKFVIVLLKDQEDFSRIKARMKITSSIIKTKVDNIIEINSIGNTLLSRLFSLIYIGDFVSVYLAILNSCNPTTILSIDLLKKEMAKIK